MPSPGQLFGTWFCSGMVLLSDCRTAAKATGETMASQAKNQPDRASAPRTRLALPTPGNLEIGIHSLNPSVLFSEIVRSHNNGKSQDLLNTYYVGVTMHCAVAALPQSVLMKAIHVRSPGYVLCFRK